MAGFEDFLEREAGYETQLSLYRGQISILDPLWEQPPQWYGTPPALLPLASDGSGPTCLGLWFPWFLDRAPTTVKFYVEPAIAAEIARTTAQFGTWLVVNAIVTRDGVDPEVEALAAALGVADLAAIDQATLATGDDPLGLGTLDEFRVDTPSETVPLHGGYDGSFPRLDGPPAVWERASWYEIPEEARSAWPPAIPRQPWHGEGLSAASLFQATLGQGDLGRAWLALNTPGWRVRDAVAALRQLVGAAGDIRFARYAEGWIDLASAAGPQESY